MLKQGYAHRMNFVIVPYSDNVVQVLKIAYTRGFISGFTLSQAAIKVFLKWTLEGEPGLQLVQTYSKPSKPHSVTFASFLNLHIKSCSITPIWLFKTKFGYVDQFTVYKQKVGGELLAILN